MKEPETELKDYEFVEVRGLKKRFGDIQAVDGIEFNICSGEIYALLGPNGAGKTTTISMISTLIKPDEGDALVGGKSILSDIDAVKKISGTVPQEIALYESLDAEEHLSFFARAYGINRAESHKRADTLLEVAGLKDRKKDAAGTYSGGMKRRLNLICALMHDPQFIMMDEPTAGVDPQARERIFEMVRNLRSEGRAVLYTTHYMEEAELLADRIGIVDHGRIIAEGTLKEITSLAGEVDIITLDASGPIERIENAISETTGVIQVRDDRPITITCVDAGKILTEIVTVISESGIKIKEINVKSPSLEDVFIKLTGRSLRE